MGLDAEARVTLDGRAFTARVQLETAELIVAGRPRTVIPFARVRSARADGSWLRLELADGGAAAVELGETQAARWADRIRNPKGRLDKLGVKDGHRVAVLQVDDPDFTAELATRGATMEAPRAGLALDLVFLGATSAAALGRLTSLRQSIRPEGAIWVTWPKGRPELREDDVRAAALACGLVDVKVAAFSDRLSALKLVIPLASRAGSVARTKVKRPRRS